MITVDTLVDLIETVESEDPIDWAMLAIDESEATRLIAMNLIEQYQTHWSQLSESNRTQALLATIGKLVIENFALNLRLRQ